jgi:protein SCO1/2
MKTLLAIITLIILGTLLLPLVADEQVGAETELGFNHPILSQIKLTDQDQQLFTLGDLVGKTVVLNFMFNGCSPVQTVALRRAYLDHQLERKDKGIVFLSISVATDTDTPQQLKEFAQRYNIYSKNWRLAITNKASLDVLLETLNAGIPPEAGRVGHLNTVFLLNKEGVLSKRYKGYPVSPSAIFEDLSSVLASSS